jgi:hypothetical protein
VADDSDGAVVGAQGVEDVEDFVEGVFVEGAEAFVDEEGVQGVAAGFVGDDVGQSEGQGEGGEEGLAAGESVGLAGAAGPGVGDLQAEAGACTAGGLVVGVGEGVAAFGHDVQAGVGGGDDFFEEGGQDVGLELHADAGDG